MTYHIRKAAVIGSGTMGSGIATLMAAVGLEVTLLDIPAKGTQPGIPAKGTQPGDSAAKRSALVRDNLAKLKSAKPPQLFSAADIDKIRIGTIDDNLGWLREVDWVIEVIVEKLDIKRSLMTKLLEVVGPQTIVTTNTSGLPISAICEGMPDHL